MCIFRKQKPIYQVICGHDFLLYQFSKIECYKSQYMLKAHVRDELRYTQTSLFECVELHCVFDIV